MSSQESQRIPFIYNREQQGLRLIELPSELVDALSSPKPPRFFLKAGSSQTTAAGSSTSHVVLCTSDQTYEVRQVQTSNQVYILQSGEIIVDDGDASSDSVTAFATCTNTLELSKIDKSDLSKVKTAKQCLLDALPVYHGAKGFSRITKEEVISNTPYSEEECEVAWTEIVAFTLESEAYRPSPRMLLSVWKALSESLIIEGTSAADTLIRDDLQPIVEGSDHPQPLWDALFSHLSSTLSTNEIRLDETKTVLWLSELVLTANRGDIKKATLLEDLRSLLPKQWRAAATQEVLSSARARLIQQGLFTVEEKTKTTETATTKHSTTVKRPTNSRNWHERLKRTKK